MMKDMANAAASQAQSAVQDAIDRNQQTAKDQGAGGVLQGMMGHYSELSAESAQQQYGMYLMRGESFTRCFALIRDKMLFTDRRIVFIDHQGMTGTKAAVVSIDLQSIVDVRLETGGRASTMRSSRSLTWHARTTRRTTRKSHRKRLSSQRDLMFKACMGCLRNLRSRTYDASIHKEKPTRVKAFAPLAAWVMQTYP